jgi:archaellum component FlaC
MKRWVLPVMALWLTLAVVATVSAAPPVVQSPIDQILTTVTSINTKVADILGDLTTIDSSVNSIVTQNTAIKSNLETIMATLSGIQNDLSAISTKLNGLTTIDTTVNSIATQNTAIKSNSETIIATLSGIQNDLSVTNSNLNDIKATSDDVLGNVQSIAQSQCTWDLGPILTNDEEKQAYAIFHLYNYGSTDEIVYYSIHSMWADPNPDSSIFVQKKSHQYIPINGLRTSVIRIKASKNISVTAQFHYDPSAPWEYYQPGEFSVIC